MKTKIYFLALASFSTVMMAQGPINGGPGVFGVNGGYVPRFDAVQNVTNSNIWQGGLNPSFVGMGTTLPAQPLHISHSFASNVGLKIEQAGTGASAIWLQNTNTLGRNWGIFSTGFLNQTINGAGNFAIVDGTTPRFFIRGGIDWVGIGTVNPGDALEVATSQLNGGITIDQNGSGSSALTLNNNTAGGKKYVIGSTGTGNTQGPGHFSIYDYNSAADRLFISGTNGNVGIGNASPSYKLDVSGNGRFSSLSGSGNRVVLADPNGELLTTSGDVWFVGGNSFAGNSAQYIGTNTLDDLMIGTNNIARIVVDKNGQIIFGDNPGGLPAENFTFNKSSAINKVAIGASGLNGGNAYNAGLTIANQWGRIEIEQDQSGNGHVRWGTADVLTFKNENMMIGKPFGPWITGDVNTKLVISTNTDGYTDQPFRIKNPNYPNYQNNVFEILNDGTTHIGNKLPPAPHNTAKLTVDGKVACQSLFVLKPVTWADYVFKNEQREALSDVEIYVSKNKHLPGIPSEQEILENGYDVNAMDAALLEKIEKLYLHTISLEKEIAELKKKLEKN
jgi:hypothetical protein